MRSRAVLAVVAVLLFPAGAAQATLLELDDPVFGPASITRDTDTALDWLDVPLSAGRSYDDVSIELGPGGDFAGFRYATKAEIRALLQSVGISDISGPPPSAASYEPAVFLQGLVGETSPMMTVGVNSDVFSDDPPRHFGTALWRDDDNQVAGAEDFEVRFDDGAPAPGHWLVKAIPEPSSLSLVAAGLWMMSRVRRSEACQARAVAMPPRPVSLTENSA